MSQESTVHSQESTPRHTDIGAPTPLPQDSRLMTLDIYGHLFPEGEDEFDELAEAETALIGHVNPAV